MFVLWRENQTEPVRRSGSLPTHLTAVFVLAPLVSWPRCAKMGRMSVPRLVELANSASASVTERDGNLMADRVSYDPMKGRSHTERLIVRDGNLRKVEFSLEQVPAPVLVQRLHGAGFGQVQLFGAAEGRSSPRARGSSRSRGGGRPDVRTE